jgi:hypothetical protein
LNHPGTLNILRKKCTEAIASVASMDVELLNSKEMKFIEIRHQCRLNARAHWAIARGLNSMIGPRTHPTFYHKDYNNIVHYL